MKKVERIIPVLSKVFNVSSSKITQGVAARLNQIPSEEK